MTPTPPKKVIFDTDPGVDDAMALYYALAHPAINVVGITTTFGNVFVEQATTRHSSFVPFSRNSMVGLFNDDDSE